MIYHEGDMRTLPSDVLEKYGFKKIINTRSNSGYDPGYTHRIRIHDTQYLLYDINGFITWQRIVEKKGVRGSSMDAFIIIPKPIRTKRDLTLLIKAITTKNKFYENHNKHQAKKSR